MLIITWYICATRTSHDWWLSCVRPFWRWRDLKAGLICLSTQVSHWDQKRRLVGWYQGKDQMKCATGIRQQSWGRKTIYVTQKKRELYIILTISRDNRSLLHREATREKERETRDSSRNGSNNKAEKVQRIICLTSTWSHPLQSSRKETGFSKGRSTSIVEWKGLTYLFLLRWRVWTTLQEGWVEQQSGSVQK